MLPRPRRSTIHLRSPRLALLLATIASCDGTRVSTPRHEPTPARLEHLRAVMDSGGIPGMAMAVLEDGKVAWSGGFGVRGVSDSAPVDANTVFEAASLSKPVVAYMALKLVDAGTLDLDRPLREYGIVPDLADARANRITTRMILSHTTGLQNERTGNEPLVLAFEPGERFQYSGEGFLLLQRLLESMTGQSLEVLSRHMLLDSLGMTRSGFVWRDEFADNAAIGHGDFKIARSPSRPEKARASSSFHTTAHDYALFVRALMHRRGLGDDTFKQMLTPQVHVAPGIDWGLGWALETTAGAPAAWHWGDNSNSGFTAFVWADPDRRRGVVYFANSTTGLSIVRDVLAIMEGTHAAPGFMGYERYDAPSRVVRHRVDEVIRVQGVGAGLETYQRLKSRYDVSAFQESQLNTLGYRFLALGRPADAVALFQANVREFPNSSNAFDSWGDGLSAMGNTEAAIASYLKSYELDHGNDLALRKVERLRQ